MIKQWMLTIFCCFCFYGAIGREVDLKLLRINRGVEFPGAQAQFTVSADGGTLALDFSQGGHYVGLVRKLDGKFEELEKVVIKLQTSIPLLQFRIKDKAGRFYQSNHFLSGNPDEIQTIAISQFYGKLPEFDQWGTGTENSFQGPIESYSLIFPKEKECREIKIGSIQEFGKEKIHFSGAKFPSRYRVLPGGVFQLPLSDIPTPRKREIDLIDYSGNTVALPVPAIWNEEKKQLEITMPMERGFYELSLPELQLSCGIIVAPEFPGKRDPYFAMDTALGVFRDYASEETRKSALELLTQSGIGMIRDRIVWNALEKEQGKFDFLASSLRTVDQEDAWKTVRESGCRVLNVFHDAPLWTGRRGEAKDRNRYPYPVDLVGTSESWKTIASHWGELWDALEVWNEPEIAFGNSLPGDRVAAVQHALSYTLAQAGSPIKICGGAFTGYQRNPKFFDSYIENGVFDDADLFSLHDYLEPERFENLISAHRKMLAGTAQPGIPIWITECGMPWLSKKDRAEQEEDRHSAVAISGKSFEGKACGVERMFMFVYSFYQEGSSRKNFGMCDRNFTPQRSFAVYAFSAEILANKKYVGDIPVEGAIRARVFSDGKDAVIAIYERSGTKELCLPRNLKIDAVHDIDGRKLAVPANGKLVAKNSILYLTVSPNRLSSMLNIKTKAMELSRIAKNHHPAPRPVHPVVFQNRMDTTKFLYRLSGYLVPGKEFQFDFSASNLSEKTIIINPWISAPDGAVVSRSWKGPMELPPKSEAILHCVFDTRKLFSAGDRAKIVIRDAEKANAAKLTVPLLNWKFSQAPACFLDNSCEKDNWITMEEWMPWASETKNPNIFARFRLCWNERFLRIEVVVKDPDMNQPYPPQEAWQGDSVQFGFQKLDHGKPDLRGSTEITAAITANGPVLFRHLSQSRTGQNEVLKASKLEFFRNGDQSRYLIDLDWSDLEVKQVKGDDVFGLSLLVNSNAGKGRCGILYWGEGIAVSKTPSEYNQLRLEK